MIGSRARLGLMVPSVNVVTEPEFNLMVPNGVSVHCARLASSDNVFAKVAQQTRENVRKINENVLKVALELQHSEVDVIGSAATAAGWTEGLDVDQRIKKSVEEKVGIPVVTGMMAIVDALRTLGMKRIVVATPYEEFLNETGKQFFRAEGFDVLVMETIGELGHTVSPGRVYRFSKKLFMPFMAEADGIFVGCCNFPTVEILQALENDIGKPVVSNNQALLWKMLKTISVHERIEGFGKLFLI